jgi:hypothetical protein
MTVVEEVVVAERLVAQGRRSATLAVGANEFALNKWHKKILLVSIWDGTKSAFGTVSGLQSARAEGDPSKILQINGLDPKILQTKQLRGSLVPYWNFCCSKKERADKNVRPTQATADPSLAALVRDDKKGGQRMCAQKHEKLQPLLTAASI